MSKIVSTRTSQIRQIYIVSVIPSILHNFLCQMERSISCARLRLLKLFERNLQSLIISLMTRAWMNSTQWKYCSSMSRRFDYHALCGKWVSAFLDFQRKGGETTEAHHRTIWNEFWWKCRYKIGVLLYVPREKRKSNLHYLVFITIPHK